MSSEEKQPWIFAIFTSALVSLGGFVLYESYQVNAQLAVLEEQINVTKTVKKHWKLHGWAKDHINSLRAKHGLEMQPWPDMEEHSH